MKYFIIFCLLTVVIFILGFILERQFAIKCAMLNGVVVQGTWSYVCIDKDAVLYE